ncbi:MAG: DUF429 domain-containing protein, partial [Pseudonocardia sp.]
MAGVDGVAGGWVVAHVEVAPVAGAGGGGAGARTAGADAGAGGAGAGAGGAGGAAARPDRAATVRWAVLDTAAEVLAATAGCAAVGVDIPLGLPAGPGRRACEVSARERLGRDRSSVFFTPPRAVLEAATYEQACAVARGLTGRAISLQTFHITAKIREWDALDRPSHVVEVHPELSLRALAPDVRFAGKKTTRGAGQRIAALAPWVDPAVARADHPPRARHGDVRDAQAAA